jgi:hypothetical protein
MAATRAAHHRSRVALLHFSAVHSTPLAPSRMHTAPYDRSNKQTKPCQRCCHERLTSTTQEFNLPLNAEQQVPSKANWLMRATKSNHTY